MVALGRSLDRESGRVIRRWDRGNGTRFVGLFAAGLLILIFLSGAYKFVFMHQLEDESQESHLQNY